MSLAPRLLEVPMAGLYPCSILEANGLLERFAHNLGPIHRPFRQEAFAYEVDGEPVAVAVSASIVNGPVAAGYFEDKPEGFARDEVVELARLAGEPWATRVMVRMWRELCAPRWKSWPVKAAVAYSQNARHPGNLYRFDGWTKVRDDAGSSGGGSWSRKRYATDAVFGKKTLWIWRYEEASA